MGRVADPARQIGTGHVQKIRVSFDLGGDRLVQCQAALIEPRVGTHPPSIEREQTVPSLHAPPSGTRGTCGFGGSARSREDEGEPVVLFGHLAHGEQRGERLGDARLLVDVEP